MAENDDPELGAGAEDALAYLQTADARLGRAIAHIGPCRLHPSGPANLFQALLRAIIYQQLSGQAAYTIYRRVCALHPGSRPPGPRQLHGLPAAAMREAGMSHAKIAAAKDLAARALARKLPSRRALAHMDDAEIIERLTEVRGIGRWTVEMLLIFNLGRPDVLPATDLGIRKGFHRLHAEPDIAFGPDTPIEGPFASAAEILAHGERWRPYRSVAAWYLWRIDQPVPPR